MSGNARCGVNLSYEGCLTGRGRRAFSLMHKDENIFERLRTLQGGRLLEMRGSARYGNGRCKSIEDILTHSWSTDLEVEQWFS